MSLLLTMLPIYLLGNLHCLGMCGPLVAMLGANQYRSIYFFGRILSFTLAAAIAAEAGAILNFYLQKANIGSFLSIGLGILILWIGYRTLNRRPILSSKAAKKLEPINQRLSLLMLQDGPFPLFLFGLLTVALPCGQTFLVFSACALSADFWTGAINGFAFAILTSPSLFFAMQLHQAVFKLKKYYNLLLGICSLIIGALAICRGLAEIHLIDHWILNQDLHLVMY